METFPALRLSKPSRRQWFKTPSRSLWCHSNDALGVIFELCCGLRQINLTNIQNYFIDTGAIIRVCLCMWSSSDWLYRQVSNIRCTKSQNLKDSRTVLWLSLPNPLKPDVSRKWRCSWAAPTADAPNTSEWSTISLHTKVSLILEVLR